MRGSLLVATSLAAVMFGTSLARADGSDAKSAPPVPFSWSGVYIGYHSGVALGSAQIGDPFGPSIYGDTVRSPGGLAGVQAGSNGQVGSTVFGIEFDVSGADLQGTHTCFAFSPAYLSSNCLVGTHWLGTLTGRLGVAVGAQGRTLFYGKAGAAFESNTFKADPGGGLNYPATQSSGPRFGWTVGAGVEHSLTGNWSVKAEYGYLAFSPDRVPVPASELFPPTTLVAGTTTSMSTDIHMFKLGLNYRLGAGGDPLQSVWGGSAKNAPARAGNEFEVGARYVSSWGRFQKDIGVPAAPGFAASATSLASRLTYDGMSSNGAELFARLDLHNNLMVKGFVGLAGGSGGSMNDEDWAYAPAPAGDYSNTVSNVHNNIKYGTIDAGYDWLRGPGYRVASFVGYNVIEQRMKALGCTQIADPLNAAAPCVPAIPAGVLGITETDTWQSIRLGSAADFAILPRMKVSVDAAYLPYVWFDGRDDHILRGIRLPQTGNGQGVQFEAAVSYAVTNQLSIGVGGRYWAMWTKEGSSACIGTANDSCFIGYVAGTTAPAQPSRAAIEEAAVMFQASYKFGGGPN